MKFTSDSTTNLQSSAVTEKTTTKLQSQSAFLQVHSGTSVKIKEVSAVSWRENSLIMLSQSIATGQKVSNCWVCHLISEDIQKDFVPLIVPVIDFGTVPEPMTYYHLPPPGRTFKVRLIRLHKNASTPCFTLSEKIFRGPRVRIGPPRSLDFLLKKCDEQNPLKCMNDKCERAKSDTNSCQRVRKVKYNVTRIWKACTGSDPWLENVLSVLPQKESINFTTLGGITCAPAGYYFVCGTGNTPRSEGRAYRCLDSWEIQGSCLLGYVKMPLSLYSLENISLLAKPNTYNKRMILAVYEKNIGQSSFGNLTPTARVYVNRDTIHNLSATIGQIAEDTDKSTVAQHISLNSLTRVFPGNRIVHDFLLAEQGGVCVMVNNTCCTYINTSGEVETRVNKILQKATWL
ncbi:LOW QUALITY PROTEIN: syncytin-2-like [Cervus elaphus]|uniref:LOW QUALITY PROTEIN: syncytin-2-like n=1 Tax=Cervus canadensis TaxID=1574408 RepID=UPI001C9E6825|nr:LOW QUALITY PROTEIN: syncytin-2-like [Cervus canadensis]XP_043733938.1 LOW QUALITY PROTEIN: syncytin-2-like [Cervus elaphus]